MLPSHHVCAMVWRRNPETGKLQFLVMDCHSTDPEGNRVSELQVKFPGGDVEKGEDLLEALSREVKEETELEFIPQLAQEVSTDASRRNHVKHGFLLPSHGCKGSMRTVPKNQDGDEMSPPYYQDVEVLLTTGASHIYKTHQPHLEAACRKLGVAV